MFEGMESVGEQLMIAFLGILFDWSCAWGLTTRFYSVVLSLCPLYSLATSCYFLPSLHEVVFF